MLFEKYAEPLARPAKERAKRNDPDTSHEAAELSTRQANNHRDIIHAWIAVSSRERLTAPEIHDRLVEERDIDWDLCETKRRLTDLKQQGYLVQGEKKTPPGRKAASRVYVLPQFG